MGVDIGSSSIKIVQLKKDKGVVELETYGSLAIGPYVKKEVGCSIDNVSDKILLEVFTDLLKESGVSTRSAGLSIPFSASLISLIEVPNVAEKKLAQIIPYEVRKYIPIPIEEVSIDWFIVPENVLSKAQALFEPKEEGDELVDTEQKPKDAPKKEDKAKVLLVAIHNDQLSKYKNVAQSSNLNINFFEIEIFSVLRSVLPRNFFPTLIIDMGANTTKFYIVENGVILRSHFINKGGQDITLALAKSLNFTFSEAEAVKRAEGLSISDENARRAQGLVVKDIIGEINSSLGTFQNKYRKNVGKVVLTGGGSILEGFLDLAKENINVDIEMASPFFSIKTPKYLANSVKRIGPEFSVAIGSALRSLGEEDR